MQEDRKTPEMRAQMTDIERLRHSTAHVLATAILKIWPEAQFAAGPPVENGFYYDVDLPHRISPDDFEKIEAEMRKEIKADHPFERMEVSRDEALELGEKGRLAALSERPEPSKFKLDIIENIPPDEKISLYRSGDFIDLCAGPHVKCTGEIGAFKVTSVASAYYKGDEKNPQLQRVYGTAFKTKKELDDYFAMLEEAKKRDHRKLGRELELFVFDDDVGPGLPMFLPRGAVIAEELEKLAKETEFAAGYQRVLTPHIARESLYLKSGHLPYYAESMFPPMELRDEAEIGVSLIAAKARLEEDARSFYEDNKQVVEELTLASGREQLIQDLRGRLAPNQLERFNKLSERTGFAAVVIAQRKPDRYYLKAMNCPHHHKLFASISRSYRDLPLRMAEYGTDYRYEKSGELFGLMRVRSLQMNDAHIYCTPEQFEAEFNSVNEMYLKYFKLFGIEKYLMRFSTHDPSGLGQKFVNEPELWKQTEEMTRRVLKNSEIDYVEVPNEAAFYGPKIDVQVWSVIGREEIDESSDKINGKVQRAEQMKVHTMFVIGKRDLEKNEVSVRVHGQGNLGAKPRAEAIAEILQSIKERCG